MKQDLEVRKWNKQTEIVAVRPEGAREGKREKCSRRDPQSLAKPRCTERERQKERALSSWGHHVSGGFLRLHESRWGWVSGHMLEATRCQWGFQDCGLCGADHVLETPRQGFLREGGEKVLTPGVPRMEFPPCSSPCGFVWGQLDVRTQGLDK